MSLARCLTRAVWFVGGMLVSEAVPEKPALLYCWKQQCGYCVSFCFCGHVCVCVCECLSLCSSTCKLPVCLCIWKEKCVNVYLYFAVAYIQHACVLHLSTQTRCLLFWDLRQIWPSYCFLVFTTSCFLVFFRLAALLSQAWMWKRLFNPGLMHVSLFYILRWMNFIYRHFFAAERTKMLSLLLLMYN